VNEAPVHYIEARAFSYSTEDPVKVKKALSLFLPEDVKIKKEVMEGNFGNEILVLKSKIEKSKEIKNLTSFLLDSLTDYELSEVLEKLEERVSEDCSFYLRFDKQKAYKGNISLTEKGDAILLRFKIAAYPAKKRKAIKNVEDLFSI